MDEKWTPPFCTVVAVDMAGGFSYRSCSTCERALPDDPSSFCSSCAASNSSDPQSSRLYRVLVSVATADRVMVVVCFDRAARLLFGCSADEFFHFCRLHPFAAEKAAQILEGEMLRMTLAKPKSGNAQHLRAVSVVPLRTGFRPVIETLKQVYGGGGFFPKSKREVRNENGSLICA